MAASTVDATPSVAPTLLDRKSYRTVQEKRKKVVRNLWANPFGDYWPELSLDENKQLEEAFNKLFQSKQINGQLKLKKKHFAVNRKKWSRFLVSGVNEVSRCVKKGSVIAVLLDADVDPKFLLQHLATMCGIAAVPVLLISSLRVYTERLIGYSAIAIGIKKVVSGSKTNPLQEIYKLIKTMSENYKPPPSLHQFTTVSRRKSRRKKKTLREKQTLLGNEPTPSTNLHLYRKSCEGRVFVPKLQKMDYEPPIKKPKLEETLGDFLRLEFSDSDLESMEINVPVKGISLKLQNPTEKQKPPPPPPSPSSSSSSSSSYTPLKIVRVRPNPDKKKSH